MPDYLELPCSAWVPAALSVLQCVLGLILISSATIGDVISSGDIFALVNRLDGVKQLLLCAMAIWLAVRLRRILPLWLRRVAWNPWRQHFFLQDSPICFLQMTLPGPLPLLCLSSCSSLAVSRPWSRRPGVVSGSQLQQTNFESLPGWRPCQRPLLRPASTI